MALVVPPGSFLLDGGVFLKAARGSGTTNPSVLSILRDNHSRCFVSMISIWQLLMRFKAGLEQLPEPALPMLQYERSILGVHSLAVQEDYLAHLTSLDDLRYNAFDQMLICQAKHHSMSFITDRDIFSGLDLEVIH